MNLTYLTIGTFFVTLVSLFVYYLVTAKSDAEVAEQGNSYLQGSIIGATLVTLFVFGLGLIVKAFIHI